MSASVSAPQRCAIVKLWRRLHSPASHRLSASRSDPSGRVPAETLLEFLQARLVNRAPSVSSSFPSGSRLGGAPLLQQGRQWLAGECEVKQRSHLFPPDPTLAPHFVAAYNGPSCEAPMSFLIRPSRRFRMNYFVSCPFYPRVDSRNR
jgi:hypothetical protein